jgi:hypothetical protein
MIPPGTKDEPLLPLGVKRIFTPISIRASISKPALI